MLIGDGWEILETLEEFDGQGEGSLSFSGGAVTNEFQFFFNSTIFP